MQKMFEDYPDVVGIQEASEMLNVCYTTITRMFERGELPYFKLGRHYKIRKIDLIKWIDDRMINSYEDEEDYDYEEGEEI